jgi:hypothetical protein
MEMCLSNLPTDVIQREIDFPMPTARSMIRRFSGRTGYGTCDLRSEIPLKISISPSIPCTSKFECAIVQHPTFKFSGFFGIVRASGIF